MRLLFLGDVMGRAGRAAVVDRLAALRAKLRVDFCVVNGENASGGMGLTGGHAQVLLDAGADVVTLGDHAFDQKDMLGFIQKEPRVIRPINFAKDAPGRGVGIFDASRGRKVMVAQVLGNVFMRRAFDDPFSALDLALRAHPMGAMAGIQAALIDFHAEATSEKMAAGHFCDGRASLVVGTHTHVPTGDAQILRRGTGYMTDAGMCGDYDSIIGMEKDEPMRRFVTGMNKERFTPAQGDVTLSGVLVETDDRTGLARTIWPVREGGRLSPSLPET
ncbi:MAG: YmdB family metallophosphoesterase [Paracoccus denitrificans]|uniref:YmdB family metallophosphoesterase n=1 Tax=Paracoccus denitrificans TaxID=266 RepID=A0A533I5M5_PARDE|nr:MAG: YmdB family metallophosphoesterase [Paracoccus denitrificans]